MAECAEYDSQRRIRGSGGLEGEQMELKQYIDLLDDATSESQLPEQGDDPLLIAVREWHNSPRIQQTRYASATRSLCQWTCHRRVLARRTYSQAMAMGITSSKIRLNPRVWTAFWGYPMHTIPACRSTYLKEGDHPGSAEGTVSNLTRSHRSHQACEVRLGGHTK
jgi:hypothetical protein